MTHNDFLFPLGRLDAQMDELIRRLGAMCSKLEGMAADLEREAV